MNRQVWKYMLNITTVNELKLPKGTKPLYFAMQDGNPTLWAEVPQPKHDNHPVERRSFRVFGTGHPLEEGATYVGTTFDGPFVWHLYEVNR